MSPSLVLMCVQYNKEDKHRHLHSHEKLISQGDKVQAIFTVEIVHTHQY